MSQEDGHKKEGMPDLENWDWYTGCPIIGYAFIDHLWHLNNEKSCFPAWSRDKTFEKILIVKA